MQAVGDSVQETEANSPFERIPILKIRIRRKCKGQLVVQRHSGQMIDVPSYPYVDAIARKRFFGLVVAQGN